MQQRNTSKQGTFKWWDFTPALLIIAALTIVESKNKYFVAIFLLALQLFFLKKKFIRPGLFGDSNKKKMQASLQIPLLIKVSHPRSSHLSEIGLQCTVIYDNRAGDSKLTEGFGFSCLITWENRKILFDTGGDSKAFFANAKKLNIELSTITHLVFSHQHWDHKAGFEAVVKCVQTDKAKLYLPHGFNRRLSSLVPPNLQTINTNYFSEIDKNIYSLVLKGYTSLIQECFTLYEQTLIFDTPKGLIILTGCGHPGIINIMQEATKNLGKKEIFLVIGGFHLHHSLQRTTASIVENFKLFSPQNVAPCHCTGQSAAQQFKDSYAENFYEIGTGTQLNM